MSGLRSALRSYLSNAALSIPPVLYIRDNFYSLYVVDGRSMEPSLRRGDVVLVRKSDVYPDASWRRWTSRASYPSSSSSSPAHGVSRDYSDEDDDGGDGDYDEDRNALRVLALDASSGRPIGDRWTGRTYLKPPTVHVVGSVIVHRAPDASRYPSGEYRIKRVVGLGGQLCRPGGGRGMVRVPPFALWVEGDNVDDGDDDDDDGGGERGDGVSTRDGDRARRRRSSSSSVDSRTYGPVCKNNVIGVAERIVWPPSRWGRIPGVDPPPSAPRSWWV